MHTRGVKGKMMPRHTVYEVADAGPDGPRPRRPWYWREQTGYVFYEGWRQLGRLTLTDGERRTLCALMGRCGWNNRVLVSAAQLGRDIGLSRATVYRALAALTLAGLIAPLEGEDGKRAGWLLSPALTWHGRPSVRHVGQQQFLAQVALAATRDAAAATAPTPRAVLAPSTPPDGTR